MNLKSEVNAYEDNPQSEICNPQFKEKSRKEIEAERLAEVMKFHGVSEEEMRDPATAMISGDLDKLHGIRRVMQYRNEQSRKAAEEILREREAKVGSVLSDP